MPRRATSTSASVRVLDPSEYPPSITRPQGAYTPDVRFAAVHPLGLYHVEHQGAGHHAAYFTPRRKGARTQHVGAAASLKEVLARISDHEDRMISPDAPREEGKNGPVSIFSLGKRLGGAKTKTQLDREIEGFLLRADAADQAGRAK